MFQINHVQQKSHSLDTYNFVLSQFNSIKSTGSFVNFNQISGQDLLSVCNISFDCLDKLSDVSAFIDRKQTDLNLNSVTLSQLEKLDNLNTQLHEQIYIFNGITHDMVLLVKETVCGNQNQEVINYANFDLINKYKQIIYKIIGLIKRIGVYVEILKPKLN